jgi:hypothetical protein
MLKVCPFYDDDDTILMAAQKFDSRPTIRRPPTLQTPGSSLPSLTHSNSASPSPSFSSLKRKADSAPQAPLTVPSQSQSQTLLARLQAVDSQGERSTKRAKKELSLLDRLQTASPYSDIRIKNASGSGGAQSLLEPLRRTSIEEKGEVSQVNRGRPSLQQPSSSATAEHTAKSVALRATLSIRGAASKSNTLSNMNVVAKEPRPTPSIRRPSLLERTFPPLANQVQTIEQSISPKPPSFRERLAAPSLKERLLITERAEAVGDEGSSGRRKRGGKR